MGNLVFQATLGGQVNLVGPNTSSTYNINVPSVNGNLVTTGDTGTVTNTMLAGSIANAKLTNSSVTVGSTSIALGATSTTLDGVNIGATTAGTGAFTTLSGSTSVTTPIVKSASSLTLQSNGTTTAVTIDTSQKVGIGTTSPLRKLSVSNSGAEGLEIGPGSVNGDTSGAVTSVYYNRSSSAYVNAIQNANSFIYQASGTEAMRIDSSGNLLVGTTSNSLGGQKVTFAGGVAPSADNAYIVGNSGARWSAIYAANGTIQTSDERDKTDIVDSPLGLDFICKVRPVAYKFKVGKNEVSINEDGNEVVTPIAGTRQHFGVLAQQVKESIGDVDFGGWILTDTKKADSLQGIRYDEFVAPLIKAIQELKAINDQQAETINALTARVVALEAK
jgi:hypothetical protein